MKSKTWKVQMTYHMKINVAGLTNNVAGLTNKEGPTEEECRKVISKQIEN